MTALVERETELGAAESMLKAAAEGRGGVIAFLGPTGSGKTQLLDAVCARARGPVLHASGYSTETTLGYGVVRQLFDGIVEELGPGERDRLFEGPSGAALPPLGRGPAPGGPVADPDFAGRHGVWKLLEAIGSAQGPLLVAVDDLEWSDPDSAYALAYCANRLGATQIALVCTASEPELSAAHAAILSAGRHYSLSPLSHEGCAQLVGSLMSAPVPAFASACHVVTSGWPLFVAELISAARAEGIQPDEAGAEQLRGLVPESFIQLVRVRLARLSGAAIELSHALAVLGRAPLHVAAAVAGLSEPTARAAAAELGEIGAIDDELPLRLANPIIASAIYEDLPSATRDGLHRDAAARLHTEDAGLAADHLMRCEVRREGWAADTLRSAAHRALEHGAPASAVRLLSAAVEHLPAERDGELDLELGMAELVSGTPLPSVEHLQRALSGEIPPGAHTAARMALAQARFLSGDPAGGVAELRTALETATLDDPLQATLFHLYVGLARLRADGAADARARLYERARADPNASATRALLAQDAFLMAEPATTVVHHARSALADPQLITDGAVGAAHQLATWSLAATDELDAAEAAAGDQVEMAERTGSAFRRGLAAQLQTQVALRRGRLAEVLEASDRALELARGGWPYVGAAASRARAVALVAAGDLEGADSVVAEGRSLAVVAEGEPDRAWLELAEAEVGAARGDHAGALAAAQRCGEAAEAMLITNPVLLPWRSVAVRAAVEVGDGDLAGELADKQHALAESFGTSAAIGIALHDDALAGPEAQRTERLRQAVDRLEGSGSELLHAHALAALGTSLRRERQERDSRDPLRRAVERYRACGADALADAAAAELRTAGARPRREALDGADALTAGERRVAELAAAGHSNPQIASELVLTRRTVETHLTSIYRKLGIGGRGELGGELADR